MEQEIKNLLVEHFKRYSSQRKFFINNYFSGNEYRYFDVEQDFFEKMYHHLMLNHSTIDKMHSNSFFAACMKNFIKDEFKKRKREKKIFIDVNDESFDRVTFNYSLSEEVSTSVIEKNLSDLIVTCQFSELDKELVTQHFCYGVKYVVLNIQFNHTNTQQIVKRLIDKLRKQLERIQDENPDFDIKIINDLK